MARQSRFQVIGMGRQPEQDRDPVESDPLFLEATDLLDDIFALEMFVVTLGQLGVAAWRFGGE